MRLTDMQALTLPGPDQEPAGPTDANTRPVTPFVLLSSGRTGSTYVYRQLADRPDILMFGEIFQVNPQMRKLANGQKFVDGTDSWAFAHEQVFATRKPGIAAAGFKLFYFHARTPGPDRRIWDELEARPEIRIIRLGRRNFLASYISEERARVSSFWHPKPQRSDYEAPVRLTIDIAAARRFLANEAVYAQRVADLQQSHPLISFDYEDLVADAPARLRECLTFLRVSTAGFAPAEFREGSTARGRTVIDNLDEVEAMLDAEGIGWMIDPYR